MTWSLYIDDIRTPTEAHYVLARSVDEAIKLIEERGCPAFISFDHDLGAKERAIDLVKWLIDKDLDALGASEGYHFFIPLTFRFHVHSANPVGSGNIQSLITSYLEHRKKEYEPARICTTRSKDRE